MAPFDLTSLPSLNYALVFLAIGLAFGATLEVAGFGDSRKLAAQFYLGEMTVLKVMFTAIIVACVLIFLASSFGLLDFSRVWVNPTYLWPGIAGGLIMGVGFIVGGFCPGTSLVAAATFKLDGVFFVLGVLFGVFVFGETVGNFETFFLSSYMGRFMLPDWLGLPTGVVVLLVVLMAIAMFYAAEVSERFFGRRERWATLSLRPRHRGNLMGAAALVSACLVLVARGQPTPEEQWQQRAALEQPRIDNRDIFVHPAEVVDLNKNPQVSINVFDLRSESDFNLFHLTRARRIAAGDVRDSAFVRTLLDARDNAVSFLVSNGENDALAAWKTLRAQGVLNVYVIEGGINHWLDIYPPPPCVAEKIASVSTHSEALAYDFTYAAGSRLPSAHPDLPMKNGALPCAESSLDDRGETWSLHEFTNKVKLQGRKMVKGGCG